MGETRRLVHAQEVVFAMEHCKLGYVMLRPDTFCNEEAFEKFRRLCQETGAVPVRFDPISAYNAIDAVVYHESFRELQHGEYIPTYRVITREDKLSFIEEEFAPVRPDGTMESANA